MSNRLQNKVIIVTGAAQGIGFACARQCASEGAYVVLADIQQDRGEQAAAAIRKEGGRASFHPVDVRDESQCAALVDHIFGTHKKLDGLVNKGSICGIQSLPNLVAYGAAKGGLLALTRTLAGALAEHRIRVNYVIPGWVFTEGELAIQKGEGRTPEDLRKAGEKLAFGRAQTPQETAYAVVYLLSDESTQVTGTTLHLDAGASTLPIQPGTYPG